MLNYHFSLGWLVMDLIYTNNVEVKLLLQLCKGFTNEQIKVTVM